MLPAFLSIRGAPDQRIQKIRILCIRKSESLEQENPNYMNTKIRIATTRKSEFATVE